MERNFIFIFTLRPPSDLKKGDRLELQNVKVVVEKPRFEAEDKLRAVISFLTD